MGIGAVYHTLNPRLFPEQIAWIVNHAEDRVMFVDLTFVPLLEKLADKLPSIERYVVLTDGAHMPQTDADATRSPMKTGSPRSTATSHGGSSTRTPPPACATRPAPRAIRRACVYSHRSNVLHAMMAALPDAIGIGSARRDACRWCRCSTPMAGRSPSRRRWSARRWCCPAPKMDGASIYELLDEREGDVHRRGADRVADAAAVSGSDRHASCRT